MVDLVKWSLALAESYVALMFLKTVFVCSFSPTAFSPVTALTNEDIFLFSLSAFVLFRKAWLLPRRALLRSSSVSVPSATLSRYAATAGESPL